MSYFPKREWVRYLEELATEAIKRWPGVSITSSGTKIQASIRGVLTGSLELNVGGEDYLSPQIGIGSSTCCPSSLISAQAHHQDQAKVLEVLFFWSSRVDGVRVYSDGNCPCSHCSGRGTVAPGSGTPCTNCDGKGVR